jgi:UDPglucose--hexose-1-phosphate uridylyltransferase
MPELRKDPISGRWVIISTERSKRPDAFAAEEMPPPEFYAESCPFDEGRETLTREEIVALRGRDTVKNGPGWAVRVIPNKVPVLQVEGDLARYGVGMFDMMNGIGAHELIIETPRHGEFIPDMDEIHIQQILWVFRDRMVDLYHDSRIKYVLIFKNHRISPEVTYGHCISQLIAMPILPKQLKEEMAGAKTYFDFKERCIFCDIIRQELADGDRVIDENNSFIIFAPYASRSPFEANIFPKKHSALYNNITKEQVSDLAAILKRFLRKVRAALKDPPYNVMMHTRPSFVGRGQDTPTLELDYHWHLEFVPKLTKLAGFEWGSGFYINPSSPEEGAKFLRDFKDY